MYKSAFLVYVITLGCYILFSRSPDYFDGEMIRGTVYQNNADQKFIQYRVGKEVFTKSMEGWGASQVAKSDTVMVIYNPDKPTQASHYSFFSYWFTLRELVTSFIAFAVLFAAAIFITGKEQPDDEENKPRARKYDD